MKPSPKSLTADSRALHARDGGQADEHWPLPRRRAWQRRFTSPNNYFYHYLHPKYTPMPANASFSLPEHRLFLSALRRLPPPCEWGTFSLLLPGRTGCECRRYFHRLGRAGFIAHNGVVKRQLVARGSVVRDPLAPGKKRKAQLVDDSLLLPLASLSRKVRSRPVSGVGRSSISPCGHSEQVGAITISGKDSPVDDLIPIGQVDIKKSVACRLHIAEGSVSNKSFRIARGSRRTHNLSNTKKKGRAKDYKRCIKKDQEASEAETTRHETSKKSIQSANVAPESVGESGCGPVGSCGIWHGMQTGEADFDQVGKSNEDDDASVSTQPSSCQYEYASGTTSFDSKVSKETNGSKVAEGTVTSDETKHECEKSAVPHDSPATGSDLRFKLSLRAAAVDEDEGEDEDDMLDMMVRSDDTAMPTAGALQDKGMQQQFVTSRRRIMAPTMHERAAISSLLNDDEDGLASKEAPPPPPPPPPPNLLAVDTDLGEEAQVQSGHVIDAEMPACPEGGNKGADRGVDDTGIVFFQDAHSQHGLLVTRELLQLFRDDDGVHADHRHARTVLLHAFDERVEHLGDWERTVFSQNRSNKLQECVAELHLVNSVAEASGKLVSDYLDRMEELRFRQDHEAMARARMKAVMM